jgi:hypothetical protein
MGGSPTPQQNATKFDDQGNVSVKSPYEGVNPSVRKGLQEMYPQSVTPEQGAKIDAEMRKKTEEAHKPSTSEDAFQKTWKGATTGMSPNSYGRDSSKPLSSEQAIDIGLA